MGRRTIEKTSALLKRAKRLLRDFASNRSGNFAMQTALVAGPVFLASMAALDVTNMMRVKENVCNALDASVLAAGREYMTNGDKTALQTYGRKFLDENISTTDKSGVAFSIDFPQNSDPNAQISATASLTYKSFFGNLPAFFASGADWNQTKLQCTSTIKLQNTVEVALVLDNSGSMKELGNTKPQIQRIELLKSNSLKLMDTVFNQSGKITRLVNPVQFSIVPFASSVNVAWKDKDGKVQVDKDTPWMDGGGRSPIHHQMFDWNYVKNATLAEKTLSPAYPVNPTPIVFGSIVGNQVLDTLNRPITRFTVMENMLTQTGSQASSATYKRFTQWKGCVEARPYPYNINDTEPSLSDGASLFVPMFASDEGDRPTNYSYNQIYTYNNYWPDRTNVSSANTTAGFVSRQKDVKKYFVPWQVPANNSNRNKYRTGSTEVDGPQASCDTAPLQPLTADRTLLTSAINAMTPNGATNVTEGIAWGMRTLTSGEPFTEARPESERGNDKIMVVLTDGANTYYTPQSLNSNHTDPAGNKSIYSAYGYTGTEFTQPGGAKSRLTMGTTISTTAYDNASYGKAMNQHMLEACAVAKTENPVTKRDTIQVLVIALDLNASSDKDMIADLRKCASDKPSWFTMANGEQKLFWNVDSKGATAAFEEIAKLLSVLRISS